MLFAVGTSLSDESLPSYVEVAATLAGAGNDNSFYHYESIHDLSVCSFLGTVPGSEGSSVVAVAVDPAYDGYSVCACGDG